MHPPLYQEVHDLALRIVNASSDDDDHVAAEAYAALKNICELNEGGDLDHPLQWEALGDFSENHIAALQAYEKGLYCAARLNLAEYTASIKFAMAESYHAEGQGAEAYKFAREAKADARNTGDDELKTAIKEFLAEITKKRPSGA